jgi:anti-sigma-K factor RskA
MSQHAGMSQHVELEELAMYALESLPMVESFEIRDHLKGCSQCMDEFRAVGGDLAMYGFSAPEYSVPTGSRERFLQEIAAGPRRVPAIVPRKKPAAVVPWLGWAVAAALALFAVNLYQQTHGLRESLTAEIASHARMAEDAARAHLVADTLTDAHAMRVTLSEPALRKTPSARATYLQAKGTLLFAASNLQPLKAGKVYELWLLPADNSKPVPAGTFSPNAQGEAELVLPKVERPVAAKAFGVTIENEGGSESPTMPIVLAGS